MPRGGQRDYQPGRPKKAEDEKMVARLIDLPPAMWDELSRVSALQKPKQKRNAYIRQVLQHALDLDLPASPE